MSEYEVGRCVKNIGKKQQEKPKSLTKQFSILATGIAIPIALTTYSLGMFPGGAYDNDIVLDPNMELNGQSVLIVADIDKGRWTGKQHLDSKFSNVRLRTVDPENAVDCTASDKCKDMVEYIKQANWNQKNIQSDLMNIRKKQGEADYIAENGSGEKAKSYCASKYIGKGNGISNAGADKILTDLASQDVELSLQKDITSLVDQSLDLMRINNISNSDIAKFENQINGKSRYTTSFSLDATCNQ